MIRELLFSQVPKPCLEEREQDGNMPFLSASWLPHLQNSPRQFPAQLHPRPNPNASYNPPFLPLHSPPNSKPRPASCPNPQPQDAHPPDSMWEGVDRAQMLPLVGLAVHSEAKTPLMGGGRGRFSPCPREALGRRRSCCSSNSQESPGQCPTPTWQPF